MTSAVFGKMFRSLWFSMLLIFVLYVEFLTFFYSSVTDESCVDKKSGANAKLIPGNYVSVFKSPKTHNLNKTQVDKNKNENLVA